MVLVLGLADPNPNPNGHWGPAGTAERGPARPAPAGSVGGGPSSAGHLQLALALLEGCRSEVPRLARGRGRGC